MASWQAENKIAANAAFSHGMIEENSMVCAEIPRSEARNILTFIQEYNLSKEPLRADLLVIRKEPGVQIAKEIGRIFKGHNIIEYKNPDDGLTIDDFYKAAAYACLYKSLEQTVDQYPGKDITVSLFREAYPRELFAALRSSGRSIEEKFPERSGDAPTADCMRRENLMCEALEDLMKDVIEKRVEEKVSQAVKLNTEQVTERVTEQKDKEMAVKLFGKGMSMDTIAELVGRSMDVILQWVSPVSQA